MHLMLGRVPTVVVSSSDTARQVLRVHDLHCCTRPSLSGTQISISVPHRIQETS